HIFDFAFSFPTSECVERRVQVSETYPARWKTSIVELDTAFRKGNTIPIRFSPSDFTFARTEKYLGLFTPSPVANLLFATAAPWIFAAPVGMRLLSSRRSGR